MKTFEQAIDWHATSNQRFTSSVTEDWTQGRTAFGGLLVGAAIQAMSKKVLPDRILRTLQTTFIAPVFCQQVELSIQILREGSSLTQVEAKISQNDEICAFVIGCFGQTRKTQLGYNQESHPQLADAESLPNMPYIEGLIPAFLQHVELRWTGKNIPFSGAKETLCQGWCRWKETNSVTTASVISLMDAWPPPLLLRAKKPIRASSITWLVNLYQDLPSLQYDPQSWWLFQSHSSISKDGYADTHARLWDQNGQIVAHSTQMVAEFS